MSNKEQKSTTFNWGKGLTVVIVLFVFAVLGVVGFLVTLDYEMVTENHYEEAVNYQKHIDQVEQAQNLETPVTIVLSKNKNIVITFPSSFQNHSFNGTIELYRPSDSSLDKTYNIELDEKGRQTLSAEKLPVGKWRVKVSWNTGDKDFFTEKTIFI
ncbi:FixH family protein [Fodinibius saliphilus]|uniref:FixH family protein n=1 Tax=Fodinibius saliphilus TaxID=1920650 RepID=UPI0011094B21|nr:FixH family protein [Fodinibius saliphilus]